ncbi:hypothetical protein [Streptomyces sp. NPDC001985]|uniref:hypothetical protein n=1 Tax=Streptomyces sp. NPDC001985 TaxID=3154406 RepID=UPI003327ED0F
MNVNRAAVLGSAPEARHISNEFRTAGVPAASWILPGGCGGREAARFAEVIAAQGEWADRLAHTEITVTAFHDSRILGQAVVPHVLPHLPIGSVWLQLGRTAEEETAGLARAAADHEISFLAPGRTGGSFRRAALRDCLLALTGFGAQLTRLPRLSGTPRALAP